MAVANAYSRTPDWMSRTPDWMWPNILYYWGVLYRAKWFVLGVTFIFALVGVGYAVTATNVYQATVVVASSHREALANRRFARAANLFGLGSGLADALNVGSGSNTEVALATLRSRDFLRHFAEKQRMRKLYKPPDFDRDASDRDASDRDEIRDIPPFQQAFMTLDDAYRQFRRRLSTKVEELMRKLYKPSDFDRDVRQRDIPDSKNTHGPFRRIIAIERKPRQGLINVNVRWKDPVVAAEWANAVIADLNSVLRDRAIAQARKRIAYLNRELDKTSVIPLRQAIYRLIETETRTIMVAETRSDYAFKVIDRAIPPKFDSPIRPKRGLLIRTTALMGFVIAVLAAILRDFVRTLREQDGGSPAAP